MKDTTINNTLFQAEFNTDLQLTDLLEWLGKRANSVFDLVDPKHVTKEEVRSLIELNDMSVDDVFDADSRDDYLNATELDEILVCKLGTRDDEAYAEALTIYLREQGVLAELLYYCTEDEILAAAIGTGWSPED